MCSGSRRGRLPGTPRTTFPTFRRTGRATRATSPASSSPRRPSSRRSARRPTSTSRPGSARSTRSPNGEPERLCLPHFGVVEEPAGHIERTRERLRTWAGRVRDGASEEEFVRAAEQELEAATDPETAASYTQAGPLWQSYAGSFATSPRRGKRRPDEPLPCDPDAPLGPRGLRCHARARLPGRGRRCRAHAARRRTSTRPSRCSPPGACQARRSTSSRRAARSSAARAEGTATSSSTSTVASRAAASRACCRPSSRTGSCSSTTRTEDGDSRVVRYTLNSGLGHVQPGSRTTILRQHQPFSNHNGGTLQFRGGHLYLSLGDGGDGCDTAKSAQNLHYEARQASPPRLERLEDRRLRPAQPLALVVRPHDRRHLHRRRRPVAPRGGRFPGCLEGSAALRRTTAGTTTRATSAARAARRTRASTAPANWFSRSTRTAAASGRRSSAATSTAARNMPAQRGRYFFGDDGQRLDQDRRRADAEEPPHPRLHGVGPLLVRRELEGRALRDLRRGPVYKLVDN